MHIPQRMVLLTDQTSASNCCLLFLTDPTALPVEMAFLVAPIVTCSCGISLDLGPPPAVLVYFQDYNIIHCWKDSAWRLFVLWPGQNLFSLYLPSTVSVCALIKKVKFLFRDVFKPWSWLSLAADLRNSSTCLESFTTGCTVPGHLLWGWQTPSSLGVRWVCSCMLAICWKKLNQEEHAGALCRVCWSVTHPGCAHLHHGSLRCSCCHQHRTKTITTALEVLQDYSYIVQILPWRLEGTNGQKLFSHRVPQQRQGALGMVGTWPEGLSTRSQDPSAKASSMGSSVIWKHKRKGTEKYIYLKGV